ncbi:hypothetical protein G7Y89_g14377 [Cudoniella acicularis]|uniref:non-specific serine/threonine protein kinase n=1 Tax=Cudoniella acicularis TaxID=354080 RepID=A0A8H4R4J4_9HELO|nr:hypothetical protein G7Y89_g14377 [Cudoniella acicularis]
MGRQRTYGAKKSVASAAAAAIFGAPPKAPSPVPIKRDALADITSAIGNISLADDDNEGEEEEEEEEEEEVGLFTFSTLTPPHLAPIIEAYRKDAGRVLEIKDWHDLIAPLSTITKIAEASYAEVYRIEAYQQTSILKMIRLQSPTDPDSLHISSAIKISSVLSELRIMNALTEIPGFVTFKDAHLIQGKTTDFFKRAYNEYAEEKDGSEFPDPDSYTNHTLFLAIELGDAGTVLDEFKLFTIAEVWDILLSTIAALGKGEIDCEFEHRDLHENNICIDRPLMPRARENPELPIRFGFSGLEITLIDYGLSRASLKCGDVVYLDLEEDLSIFQASDGNPQFNAYKKMRTHLFTGTRTMYKKTWHNAASRSLSNGHTWSEHIPYTNVIWISYLFNYLKRIFKETTDEDGLAELKKFIEETKEFSKCLDTRTKVENGAFMCAQDVFAYVIEVGWMTREQAEFNDPFDEEFGDHEGVELGEEDGSEDDDSEALGEKSESLNAQRRVSDFSVIVNLSVVPENGFRDPFHSPTTLLLVTLHKFILVTSPLNKPPGAKGVNSTSGIGDAECMTEYNGCLDGFTVFTTASNSARKDYVSLFSTCYDDEVADNSYNADNAQCKDNPIITTPDYASTYLLCDGADNECEADLAQCKNTCSVAYDTCQSSGDEALAAPCLKRYESCLVSFTAATSAIGQDCVASYLSCDEADNVCSADVAQCKNKCAAGQGRASKYTACDASGEADNICNTDYAQCKNTCAIALDTCRSSGDPTLITMCDSMYYSCLDPVKNTNITTNVTASISSTSYILPSMTATLNTTLTSTTHSSGASGYLSSILTAPENSTSTNTTSISSSVILTNVVVPTNGSFSATAISTGTSSGFSPRLKLNGKQHFATTTSTSISSSILPTNVADGANTSFPATAISISTGISSSFSPLLPSQSTVANPSFANTTYSIIPEPTSSKSTLVIPTAVSSSISRRVSSPGNTTSIPALSNIIAAFPVYTIPPEPENVGDNDGACDA